METTTRVIPREVLPYWKSLEGLSNDNKVILIALLSNSIVGNEPKNLEQKQERNDASGTKAKLQGPKKYKIDALRGIIASDYSDEELLDEYLADKYHV